MSYKVFLEKLGLESNRYRKSVPEPPKLALGWLGISPPDKTKQRNRAASQDSNRRYTGDPRPDSRQAADALPGKRIGRITRADLRQALEVPQYNPRGPQGSWSSRRERHTPRPRLSPAQVRELLILLDPEHTGVITQPSLKLLNPRRVHRRSWRMWLRLNSQSQNALVNNRPVYSPSTTVGGSKGSHSGEHYVQEAQIEAGPQTRYPRRPYPGNGQKLRRNAVVERSKEDTG
ncbi:uncharacterized protein LOC115198791 isoform X2 [Salmo trutta]|uniref:uncharacterized protein LOC115198791 isoform X2 n=1 Tax=Salmo trutta TaxID=8032 RepID=UPI001131A5D3|nr:uncharacterized protein LOC115198791 isoform X2 [Salmo trutta]